MFVSGKLGVCGRGGVENEQSVWCLSAPAYLVSARIEVACSGGWFPSHTLNTHVICPCHPWPVSCLLSAERAERL
jgi:hypothetical protein